jgi:hypothetical protein
MAEATPCRRALRAARVTLVGAVLVGGLIPATSADAQLLPGTPPLPIPPIPSPPEKVLPPPPPLPPAPVTVETSPAPQVKVEPAPTVKAAPKLPVSSPLPPPVKTTTVLPTVRPAPKPAASSTSAAPASPSGLAASAAHPSPSGSGSGSGKAPGAPLRASTASKPLARSASLPAGGARGSGRPGSGRAELGSSGIALRPGQAGAGTASPASRNLIRGLSPVAARKHASDGGLFGLGIPPPSGDLILATLAALIGTLIAALAVADNVGVGPRHGDWRHLWIRRLRVFRSRFTSEALGAGAMRVRASRRRLALWRRRLRSRRQPLSR